MCSGNSKRKKAKREAKKQKRKAERRQRELDRLAREREQIARAQQAKLAQLQHKQAQQKIAQKKKVDAATLAHKNKVTKLKAQQAAAEVQAEKNLAAGQAVGASLRILADREGSSQAPSATQSKRNRRAGGARSTTASLNIGSTASGSGSGSNLAI